MDDEEKDMADSFQNEVPAARVNIKLDLHTGNAKKKVELPLKLLAVGDYSNGKEQRPLSERDKVDINKNNFNSVMAEFSPAVNLTVEDTLNGNGNEQNFALEFKSLKDFEPEQVAKNIPQLRVLLAMRNLLRDLKEAYFYLSVRSSLPAHQVLHQLPLVCKIGAPDDVTLLINVALNGVQLVPLTSVPAALPLRLENQYFALDMHSDAAKSMLESGSCMIYAPGTMGDLKPELFAVLRT